MSMTGGGGLVTRTGVRLDARARMRHILALNQAGMEHSGQYQCHGRSYGNLASAIGTQLDTILFSGAFHQPCDGG
jgi:hypothetical protein